MSNGKCEKCQRSAPAARDGEPASMYQGRMVNGKFVCGYCCEREKGKSK